MTTLADIEVEIENILSVADELPENKEEVTLEYLDELALQETDKADGIVYALRKRQSEIQFLKDEEDRIKARRKSMEKRLSEFKDYLSNIFQREGITKIKGLKGTIYLQRSTSLNIIDINALPADLVETKVEFKPRKKNIKEQLQEGKEVPGANLQEKQVLCVK